MSRKRAVVFQLDATFQRLRAMACAARVFLFAEIFTIFGSSRLLALFNLHLICMHDSHSLLDAKPRGSTQPYYDAPMLLNQYLLVVLTTLFLQLQS
jgi:hypothetical protein